MGEIAPFITKRYMCGKRMILSVSYEIIIEQTIFSYVLIYLNVQFYQNSFSFVYHRSRTNEQTCFLQTKQLQDSPFQYLIKFPFQFFLKLLNAFIFSENLSFRSVVQFIVSRFRLHFSLTNILFSLILQIFLIKQKFDLFFILYAKFLTFIDSFLPFLRFLRNICKVKCNHYIKIEGISFEDVQFCSWTMQKRVFTP